MPLTTTHALVPLAGWVGLGKKPVQWRLILAAMIASAVPDLDGFADPIFHLQPGSIYAHRGAAHSLFVALAFGLIAALFHRRLKVHALTAGVVVGTSMASHGILDMMADSGLPVAYLWPLSSLRFFADWRPIHGGDLMWVYLSTEVLSRLRSEVVQPIASSSVGRQRNELV